MMPLGAELREDAADGAVEVPPQDAARVLNRGQRQMINDIAGSGLPARQIALKAGLSTASVLGNFVTGRTARLTPTTAARVATALKLPSHADLYAGIEPIEADADNLQLADEVIRSWEAPQAPARMIEVRMEAASNVWSERSSIPAAARELVPVPARNDLDDAALFAVRVLNGAENRYRPGTMLICRALGRQHDNPRTGARLVVRRSVGGFHANEVTVRELEIVGDEALLLPLGADQEILRLPWPYDGRFLGPQGRVSILGAVVAAFSWED